MPNTGGVSPDLGRRERPDDEFLYSASITPPSSTPGNTRTPMISTY